MYTPKMRGIRIELPLPIFEEYTIGKNSGCLVSKENLVDETKGIFVMPHFHTVYKIKYTDDENLLQPKIIVPIGNDMGYKLDGVGVYKKTIWDIENEWRYRVNIFPIDKNTKANDFIDRYSDLVDKKYIRKLPVDPITESTTTWVFEAPEPPQEGDIADVHSGALGTAKDGTPYANW